ncbi:uncharacterized protein [Neodiprion pinetum]|uniref:Keratin, type I cytoskeletal 9 n=1 Tax=Neodiprion lecontei TaxID=441921 RepID=A0A6J0BFV5_NEOLC|nr:keratin, type I cytoskeletal 9 [Neodiprion lecontei]XP_046488074.1 keratin, type I cytoskeletal 9-like [Neodiprion pinetum]
MNRFLGFLLLVSYACAKPATYDEYLALEDDTASVGSIRRDVRAPLPPGFAIEVADLLSAGTEARKSREAKGAAEPKKTAMKNASGKSDEGGYYKSYGSDAEGEKGYLKQTYSKGDHGYKTLDTFHKQDGDNYGFEKHTAFGKAKGAKEGGEHGESGSYKSAEGSDGDDHEGAGTIVDAHYAPYEGEHYSEGEHVSSEGGDGGHYTEGGDAGHYTSGGQGGSGSYSSGGGDAGHYSTGGGAEGSYGTHGSYSSADDSGDHQGYVDGGSQYEGDHY